MKSLLTLQLALLTECGQLCSVETARDVKTVTSRVEHEGDSFLTITLPTFAKALERALSRGRWISEDLTSFRQIRGLPAFLRGFLLNVFDEQGKILNEPCDQSVWAIRQFCLFSQKILRPTTPLRERTAFSSFVRTDQSLREHWNTVPAEKIEEFSDVCRILYSDLFQGIENKVASFELVPSHGPGATAEKLKPRDKWTFPTWSARLEEVFPKSFFGSLASSDWQQGTDCPEHELPVRVVSVPKTQVTPRIIAIEPVSMQYAQQALKAEIYAGVENSWLRNHIGFLDQQRNQNLALLGSRDGSLATLDLSEASDRVHLEVVRAMFNNFPFIRDYVEGCRSTTADVPGEGVIPLAKFASMGSALTFPIEAMAFFAMVTMGVAASLGEPPSRRHTRLVSVYGDDIIVPVYATAEVVRTLEIFGLKVNAHKSFWNGMFRESCGKEYFAGSDVSVTRMRRDLPTCPQDAAEIASLVDLGNRLHKAGLWSTAFEVRKHLDALGVRIPVHDDDSRSLVHFSFMEGGTSVQRYNKQLHRFEYRHPVAIPRAVDYRVEGEHGLLSWFLEKEKTLLPRDRDFSQERPSSFSIKTRWVSF